MKNPKTPCEVIFWQILPAVRRELARELVKRGLKQREVAEMLGLTPAALTQYLKGKRGKTELPEWIKEKIRDYAGRADCINLCDVCTDIRKDKRFVETFLKTKGGCMSA
ncbi:MAG: uncharacterized protein PWP76_363 [Candidatus Diapherotrites archaeon]|nr:uncharacterized protein [Candidatus Diapherotrites archaeon]MDN5366715.1 uncharacterized protein [Candidatus Diapherotrites archaeon]